MTRLTKHDISKSCMRTEQGFFSDDLISYCHTNVDLVDFAVHVWGVERDTATAILGGQWVLDEIQVKTYRKILSSDKFEAIDLHEPFRRIAEELLQDMSKVGHSIKPCKFWSENPKPVWANAGAVFELRKKPLPQKPWAPDANSLPSIPKGRPPALDHDTAATVFTSGKVLKGRASSQDINPLKRPSDAGSGDSEGSSQATKRQRLVQSHQQAASYALKSFASNNRHYFVYIVVESWDLTVLYFDHTLILQVAEFNFEANSGALALVLYGTHACDWRRAGFDPNLRASPASFSAATEDEHPVETPLASFFHFEEDMRGAGKTAINKTYRVTDILASTNELIGRATSVYEVRELSPNNELSSEHYALKLSWPLKSQVSESGVIQRLRDRLPADLHAHLPCLEFSTDFDAERLQLPWLQLDLELTSTNHQERVLRVLAERKYTKLWEAGSVEAFKQAWLDCVECHHQAWEVGKVMHRDLSENNLMLHWDKDGNVKGVLNDWDMAEFTDEERDPTTATHRRIGTPPFMAVDLIYMKDQTCRHSFRHELESLFYILLWAALHYDVVNKIRHNTLDVVENWQGSVNDIHTAKFLFWSNHTEAEAVFARIRPEFAETLEDWIRPLWALFGEARALYHLRQFKKTKQPIDEDKFMDAKINFITFMEAIDKKPRWACVDSDCEEDD
ncbi:hypothetical protein MD484_g3767, partial [Candolleomyces efflorescens]